MRPLLLLDVDGVLFPLGRSVPPGFERHSTSTIDAAGNTADGLLIDARRILAVLRCS